MTLDAAKNEGCS